MWEYDGENHGEGVELVEQLESLHILQEVPSWLTMYLDETEASNEEEYEVGASDDPVPSTESCVPVPTV